MNLLKDSSSPLDMLEINVETMSAESEVLELEVTRDLGVSIFDGVLGSEFIWFCTGDVSIGSGVFSTVCSSVAWHPTSIRWTIVSLDVGCSLIVCIATLTFSTEIFVDSTTFDSLLQVWVDVLDVLQSIRLDCSVQTKISRKSSGAKSVKVGLFWSV